MPQEQMKDNNIDKFPVAMAYVPWQKFDKMYDDLEKAYCVGLSREGDAYNGRQRTAFERYRYCGFCADRADYVPGHTSLRPQGNGIFQSLQQDKAADGKRIFSEILPPEYQMGGE